LRSARIVFAFVFAAFAAPFTSATDRTGVHVAIEPTASGIVARFTFERAVTSFRLSYVSDEIRDRTWKFATPDFARNGTLITKADGEPFDAFAVEVEHRNEQTNAIYANVFRVGDGLAFYAGYFVGIDGEFETTIEVRPADGHIVEGFPLGGNIWRVDAPFHRNAGDRYVYVGPASQLIKGDYAHFVFPPDLPTALTARVRSNVDGSIAFYARKLARTLPGKPLIIVAPNPESESSNNQGSATSGPMVALRLFGKRWQTFDEKADTFDHFIAHEAAHFWNSNTFHAAEGSPAWIWEGSAEVWALAARVAVMKRLSPSGRRDHLQSALNTCVNALFDEPLVQHRSNATYVCGEALYWLADAAEKKRTRGRGDIFSIWRRIFDKAERTGGIYTLHDLLAEAVTDEDTKNAFALLLAETGSERWQTLPKIVKPLGIHLATDAPDADTLRTIAVAHILGLSCDGQYGMWLYKGHMKLDTGDRCGPLSGDPEIDTLNGYSLYTDAPAAFAAAKTACDAGGEITFTRAGKPEKWTARCTKPLPPAPPKFRVVATP